MCHCYFVLSEFRLLFPQLTGVLTLAFFIHNCIITLMKSNKNQDNNVRPHTLQTYVLHSANLISDDFI